MQASEQGQKFSIFLNFQNIPFLEHVEEMPWEMLCNLCSRAAALSSMPPGTVQNKTPCCGQCWISIIYLFVSLLLVVWPIGCFWKVQGFTKSGAS